MQIPVTVVLHFNQSICQVPSTICYLLNFSEPLLKVLLYYRITDILKNNFGIKRLISEKHSLKKLLCLYNMFFIGLGFFEKAFNTILNVCFMFHKVNTSLKQKSFERWYFFSFVCIWAKCLFSIELTSVLTYTVISTSLLY